MFSVYSFGARGQSARENPSATIWLAGLGLAAVASYLYVRQKVSNVVESLSENMLRSSIDSPYEPSLMFMQGGFDGDGNPITFESQLQTKINILKSNAGDKTLPLMNRLGMVKPALQAKLDDREFLYCELALVTYLNDYASATDRFWLPEKANKAIDDIKGLMRHYNIGIDGLRLDEMKVSGQSAPQKRK